MGDKFDKINLNCFVSALSHIFSKEVLIGLWKQEKNLFDVKCCRNGVADILLLVEVDYPCDPFAFKLKLLYAR